MLERIATQHEGKLRIVKYNVDQNKDSMSRFKLRGVPTLIAYRAGEELGRHAGSSASGLKLLLEALLAESATPGDPGTSTFNNDPVRKARCVARIEQAIADGRLGGQQQERGGDDLPSAVASDLAPGGDSSDTLGLPPVIDALYNHLYEMLSADPSGAQFAVDFLRSMPVGADLSAVPRDYLLWILNDVMGNLPVKDGMATLLAEIVELHRHDVLPDAVPSSKWETLRARLEEEFGAAAGPNASILAAIDPLVRPAASIPPTAFFLLIQTTVSLSVNKVASTWFTAEEAEAFDRTNRLMAPFMKTLGARPDEGEALADYERKKERFINDAWEKAYTICPTLEKQRKLRLDAIVKARHTAGTSHAQYLLNRIAAAERTSTHE